MKNNVLLEVGPGNTLSVLAMQHPESRKNENPVTVSSLRPEYDNQSDINFFLSSVGKLWLSGIEIEWDKLYEDKKPSRIPLPTYPFQKENHWIEEKSIEIEEVRQKSDTKIKRNEFKDWFYIPSWRRSVEVKDGDLNLNALKNTNWLIFSSGSEFEKNVIDKLTKLSCKIIIVEKGKSFFVKDNNKIEIDQRNEEDFKSLFKELFNQEFYPDNILHFWNFDTPIKMVTSQKELEDSFYSNIYSLLFISKSLRIAQFEKQINIAVLTKNLHSVSGDEPLASPDTAIILGPARVMNKEIENVFCKCIDFSEPMKLREEQTNQLINEFIQSDRQEIIAYRGKYRWLQSFEHVDLLGDKSLDDLKIDKLNPGGVYLITGGTGGLGLVFAEYFAQTRDVKLILTKKSEFPERSQWQNWIKENAPDNKTSIIIDKIRKIEELGSTIDVQVCDISDENETKSLINRIKKKYGKINGIIHAAGTYDDKIIYQKNLKSVHNILAPKVLGTINLYNILNIEELDFFVLFSSISSIIAFTGQFDYSAANIYLDATTNYLNSMGFLNVISINWSAWKEVGILPNLKIGSGMEKWKQDALDKAIYNTEGLIAFIFMLNSNLSQVIVSPEMQTNDFSNNVGKKNVSKKVTKKVDFRPAKTDFYRQKETTSYFTISEIEIELVSIWQDILGAKKIKKTDNFFELGGHSLLVTQLLSSIRKSFEIELDFQELLEASTLKEMANKILEKINNFDVINNV